MKSLFVGVSFLFFCRSANTKSLSSQQRIDVGNQLIQRADYWEYQHMPYESDSFLSYWFRADVFSATMRWRGRRIVGEGQRQKRLWKMKLEAPKIFAIDKQREELDRLIREYNSREKIGEDMRRYEKK